MFLSVQEGPEFSRGSTGFRVCEYSTRILRIKSRRLYMRVKTALTAVLLCCGTWVLAQDASTTSTGQTAPSSQTSTTTTQTTTTTPSGSQSTSSSPSTPAT